MGQWLARAYVYGSAPSCNTYLLLLFVVLRNVENCRHVVAKVELLQRCLDMFACYCLFGVLFRDFVGLGRDEGDELDAAFYEQVARVFCKRHARLAGQNVLDNLLHGCCNAVSRLISLNMGTAARFFSLLTLWQRQVVVAAKLAVGHGGRMRKLGRFGVKSLTWGFWGLRSTLRPV